MAPCTGMAGRLPPRGCEAPTCDDVRGRLGVRSPTTAWALMSPNESAGHDAFRAGSGIRRQSPGILNESAIGSTPPANDHRMSGT
jgi:hypothetical protein